jgi:hypothetical protein
LPRDFPWSSEKPYFPFSFDKNITESLWNSEKRFENLTFLNPDSLVVYAGGNVNGKDGKLILDSYNSSIVIFEPVPAYFSQLKATWGEHSRQLGYRAELYNIGLGDATRNVILADRALKDQGTFAMKNQTGLGAGTTIRIFKADAVLRQGAIIVHPMQEPPDAQKYAGQSARYRPAAHELRGVRVGDAGEPGWEWVDKAGAAHSPPAARCGVCRSAPTTSLIGWWSLRPDTAGSAQCLLKLIACCGGSPMHGSAGIGCNYCHIPPNKSVFYLFQRQGVCARVYAPGCMRQSNPVTAGQCR